MIVYDLTPWTRGKPAQGQYARMVSDLIGQPVIHTGEWQSMDTNGSKAHGTHELEDVTVYFDPMPDDLDQIVPFIDHSWADDHFLERVSGIPHNPPPSHLSWPYAVRGNDLHLTREDGRSGVFDHTYPERFWPKFAGDANPGGDFDEGRYGVRFPYGDLSDLVDLLVRSPMTRQAYLPVWFPEDTGAVAGQRVPCTVGYHFMMRENRLSCRYYIRSCDIYRHFSNDVYFAAMLTRWITAEVNRRNVEAMPVGIEPTWWRPIKPGKLMMYISSLHAFTGDKRKIEDRILSLPGVPK